MADGKWQMPESRLITRVVWFGVCYLIWMQNQAENSHILAKNTFDGRYLAFFECFNSGKYFEAHERLEGLWLGAREGANGLYYKGLIQIAGAFVHLQKDRLRSASALLRSARKYLERYSPCHQGLELGPVLDLIDLFLERLVKGCFEMNPLEVESKPTMILK